MNSVLEKLIAEVIDLIKPQQGLMLRLRVSMQGTYQHPQIETEVEQFAVAVAAVFAIADEEERIIIQDNVSAIEQICTFIQQCENGVIMEFPDIQVPSQGLGLLTLWNQVKVHHAATYSTTKPH